MSRNSHHNTGYGTGWAVSLIFFMLINCIEASCPSSSWVKSSDCPGSKLSACNTQRCSYEPIYNDNVDTDCKNKDSDGDYDYNGYACCTKSGWYLVNQKYWKNNDYASAYVVCVVSLLYSFYLIILSTPWINSLTFYFPHVYPFRSLLVTGVSFWLGSTNIRKTQ